MSIETPSAYFSPPWVKAMDYFPIASTITNAAILWHKSISKESEGKTLSTHAFRPLVRESNSYWRNIILLFPFFGNLIVTIFDAYAKFRINKLLRNVQDPIQKEDIPELRSAAEYGNLQAMVQMVCLTKQHSSVAAAPEVATWYHAISHSGNKEALKSLQDAEITYNDLVQRMESEKYSQRLQELSQKNFADPAKAKNTLIDFCNELAESSQPEALRYLENLMQRGTSKEKATAAITIIQRSLRKPKQSEALLDFAVQTCEKIYDKKKVREALILLYRDNRYKKRREAFSLLSLMADRFKDRDAMSALGERYLYGPEQIEPDAWGKAIAWFQGAGNFLLLGQCFLASPNPADQRNGFLAFQNGVRAGDISCKVFLAECFLEGIGTEKNMSEAKALLDSLQKTATADAYESKIAQFYEQYFPEPLNLKTAVDQRSET